MHIKQNIQQKCSLLLAGTAIFLLFLAMSGKNQQALVKTPAFSKEQKEVSIPSHSYTGKDFSISSKGKLPAEMYANAYCLMDAATGQVLLGKDSDKELPMASTTKIMTCIIALENGNLKDKVTASSYAASMPDVQLNMKEGETFYLKDLLYSLMLESHNDTAVAIAEHIGGSVEGFAAMMNEKAIELGCTHTHFVTPNGLDSEGHYTTAEELCTIAAYAIRNKTFRSIIKKPSYQFQSINCKRTYQVRNHDAFLTNYKGALGIKTGFTGNAGYCFCGAAKRGKQTFITSVLACGWPPNKSYKWKDTARLMDYGFENFQTVSIPQEKLPPTLPLTGGEKNTLKIKQTSPRSLPFPLQEKDNITCSFHISRQLQAPIRKGDILGYERYYKNKELLYEFPILSTETAPRRTWKYYRNLVKSLFLCQTALQ